MPFRGPRVFLKLFKSIPRPKTNARVLCVLGMHRSGTSCLTGTLESWGVVLGDVHRENPHNAKGNRESQKIMDLHDKVMAANGGSWLLPPEKAAWSWAHKIALHDVILDFEGCDCWGFKDPRTLFALDYWEIVLPKMEFVGIFRSPVAVARSLNARDSKTFPSLDEGVALWAAYNRRLLEIHDRHPFPILSFDAAPEEFAAKLESVRQRLGFPKPKEEASFFSEELRHQQSEGDVKLSEEAASLYARLKALAL
jgi:hypothetical protein